MKSLLLNALLSAALSSQGQAENLFGNGSFELPIVAGPTPEDGSATVLKSSDGQRDWAFLTGNTGNEGGKLVTGITTEIARTGAQSLFIDFQKVTASGRAARLETALVPITAGKSYRVSIWGRIDRKRPLALDERRTFLALNIQFFQEDAKTEASAPIAGAEVIPGLIHPGRDHELTYTAGNWKESFAEVVPPEKAAFLKVTWTWSTPGNAGETDGAMYWDDAVLEEKPALDVNKDAKPAEPANPAPVSSAPDEPQAE